MTPRKNRIVHCFGVLDEADILERFLAYHLSIGVDGFVAVDVGSTDGTLDILSRHERAGHLHLFRANGEWNWPLIKMAREQFDAEWCLFGDVDEFWIFPDGKVRDYLDSAQSGIIIFPRYNVLPVKKDDLSNSIAHFSNFNLIVHNPIHFFYHEPENVLQNLRARRGEREYAMMLLSNFPPEILRVVGPKVIARPELVQSLAPGEHDVVPASPHTSRHKEQIGYIAHFPMRSLEQFRRKAALVAKAFDQIDSDPNHSYHWARLSVIYKHNLVEREFFRQVFSATELDRLLLEGVVRRDPNLPQALARVSTVYNAIQASS
jgi:glycosyl transferase family 2